MKIFENAIIKIKAFDKFGELRSGSAVVVKSKEIAITNFHNLKKASYFELYDGEKKIEYERILAKDRDKDILVIKLSDVSNYPDVKFSKEYKKDETVYACGYPLDYGKITTEGKIYRVKSTIEESDYSLRIKRVDQILISNPISDGNSGGGLFNIKNELIGITTGSDNLAPHINFAIPIIQVLKLLRNSPQNKIYNNVKVEKELIKYHLTSTNGEYENSLLHINKCLKYYPKDKYLLNCKIELLIDLSRIKEAITLCTRFIKKAVFYNDILINLADALTLEGKEKEALNVLQRLNKKYKDYDILVTIGFRYIYITQYEKAISCFKKARKINPKGIDHLLGLAKTYNYTCNYFKAGFILHRIVNEFPSEQYALYLLSELYFNAQKYNKSLQYIDEFIENEKSRVPENLELDLKNEDYYKTHYWEYMGMVGRIEILTKLKKFDEALQEVNNLLKYNLYEAELLVCKGRILFMLNKTNEAIENLIIAKKINPSYRLLYFELAKIYFNTNKLKKALNTIETNLKVTPNSVGNLYVKASIFFKMKKNANAVIICRKILKINNRNIDTLLLLRKYYYENGNFKTALNYAQKLLEIKPCDWLILYDASDILFKLKKYYEALPYLNKSIDWNPHPSTYILRGNVYFYLKDYYFAIKDFKEAEKLDSENVEIYYYRSKAYLEVEHYSQALLDMEKSIELNPKLKAELWPIIVETRKLIKT